MFSEENVILIIRNNILTNDNKDITIPIDYEYITNYTNKKYLKINKQFKELTNIKDITLKRDLKKLKDKKLILLTFDDGPKRSTTTKLLDGLLEYDAKVTFFTVGYSANAAKDLVKREYDEGHTVGIHTYNHKYLNKISNEEAIEEVNKVASLVEEITKEKPKYLRPPYGSYNSTNLKAINYPFILWSIDTLDWKKRDAEYISNYIISSILIFFF